MIFSSKDEKMYELLLTATDGHPVVLGPMGPCRNGANEESPAGSGHGRQESLDR